MHWGDRHLDGDDGPPLVLEHHGDHALAPALVCQECGEPVHPRDTRPHVTRAAQWLTAGRAAATAFGHRQATRQDTAKLTPRGYLVNPRAAATIRASRACP